MPLYNMTDVKLGNESVSPVTLSNDWSRLARLIVLVLLATIGSIGNVFMISAVMIDDYLRKGGNAFVVSVALADLLVTGLVIPASAVAILAGMQDNLPVCRFQWFLAALCFLVNVLSLAAIAAENWVRLCCSASANERITSRLITVLLLMFWTVSAVTSGLQFVPDLFFDYCTRRSSGIASYQMTVGIVLVFVPMFLAFFCYVRTGYQIRKAKARPNFKPSITFNWDVALMQSNIYSFVLFVAFWMPFGVVLAVGTVRRIPDSIFYNLAWLAIIKSCINNLLYCASNRHFRGAYVNLFNYCCCKTTVTFSRRQRPEGVRPSGDVRVHIIPGYNMYCSPQRGREGQGKRPAARANGRHVYEL